MAQSLILWLPSRFRRTLAALCALASFVIALGVVIEVIHRLRLFWFTYHSEPGMNHVADSYFLLVYCLCVLGIMLSIAAEYLLRRPLWRMVATGMGVLNVLMGAAIWLMHSTAALVTYIEFVAIYGP